jgi:hypothetical protein
MTITQSSATNNDADGSTTNSFTYTIPANTGTVVVLLAARDSTNGTTAPTISSLTLGGVAMTQSVTVDAQNGQRVAIYYRQNATVGDKVITATFAAAANSRLTVLSYTGAVASIKGAASATDTNTSLSATFSGSVSTSSGEYGLSIATFSSNVTATAGTNQTAFYGRTNVGTTNVLRVAASYTSTAGLTAMNWTSSANNNAGMVDCVVYESGPLVLNTGNFFMFF